MLDHIRTVAAPKDVPGLINQAPVHLRENRKVMLAAMSKINWGFPFGQVSKGLRGDRKFVLAALAAKSCNICWEDVSEELQNDVEVVLKALKVGAICSWAAVPKELRGDRGVVFAAIDS
eukprot:SAG25_NODE_8117_length_439_cov_0.761765_2_plen_118_part_01